MSFENIKGQDRAVEILKESIATGRVFSSYLFVGADGVGKRFAAKIFAKALNCAKKIGDSCDECDPCKKIEGDSHPDVYTVKPKGASYTIGIDDIRELIGKANLKPYEAKKKIFIIDEAHSMNREASNAFLKTLEEPPRDTIFILVSPSKETLLSTVVSRCHVVKFFQAPPETVCELLMKRFDMGKDEARILASFSSGRIGKAVEIREKNLIARKNLLIDIFFNGKSDSPDNVYEFTDREELRADLEFIISYMRDIFVYKTLRSEKLLFNLDRMDGIRTRSEKSSLEKLDNLIKKVITLSSYIDYNVNTKVIADVARGAVRGV